MPEIYEFNEEDFISHVIVESIALLSKSQQEEYWKCYDQNSSPMKVCFTVNGFELPAMECFRLIEKQIDEHVAEKAVKMISSMFRDVEHEIDDFKQSVSKIRLKTIKKICKKLQIEDCEE